MRESIEVLYVESGSSDGESTARLPGRETDRLSVDGDSLDVERDSLDVESDSLSVEGRTLNVEVVQSAAAGLDRLEEMEFDCVVCEYDVVDSSGIEFLEIVRREHPGIPRILSVDQFEELPTFGFSGEPEPIQLHVVSKASESTVLADRIRLAVDRRDSNHERRQWERAVELTGEGIAFLDDGVYVRVTDTYVDCFGVSKGDLLGTNLREWFTEADRLESEILPSLDEGDVWEGATQGRRADGTTVTLDLSISPGEGEVVVVVNTAESETGDRETALEALHEIATTIQTAESVSDACEQTVVAAADILEFHLCSAVIREGEWLVPYATSEEAPPDGSRRMRIDQGLAGKTFQNGESYVVDEIEPDDGSEPAKDFYRSGLSVPIGEYGIFQAVSTEPHAFDTQDVELAELLVSHTTSAIERIEREAELTERNDRLDEFASIVSHDLRNPLTVAMGHLEMVRTTCDSDHIDKVDRAHERMEALIADLLEVARTGESVREMEEIDLATSIQTCWQTVETEEARIEIDVERTVFADRSRFKQLLENLIRNAVEHGGRSVRITVGELDDGFFLEDDGPGIPEDEVDDVFEVGYSTTEGGTGFGLSIVSSVIDAHGWDVRLTDGTDGGARFEIRGIDGPG